MKFNCRAVLSLATQEEIHVGVNILLLCNNSQWTKYSNFYFILLLVHQYLLFTCCSLYIIFYFYF